MSGPKTGGQHLLPIKIALFFAAALLWAVGALLELRAAVWTAILLLLGAVLLRWTRPDRDDSGGE